MVDPSTDMTSLLTLPREIRDQIWRLLFINSPPDDAHEDVDSANRYLGVCSYPTMDGPYHLICRQLAVEHTENLQAQKVERRLTLLMVNWPDYDIVRSDVKKSLTYPSIDRINILIRPLIFTNVRRNNHLADWTACCIHALREYVDTWDPKYETVEVEIWLDQQMDRGDATTSLATSCSTTIHLNRFDLRHDMAHVYREWRFIRRANDQISQHRPADLRSDLMMYRLYSFFDFNSVSQFQGESVTNFRQAYDDLRFKMWDQRGRQSRPVLSPESRHE